MSQGVFQPVGQKRLTNVAVVRLKKNGKRFEIACYKNKVLNWRQGVEEDLDEVLQTTQIFQNVSKGQFAQHEDLQAAFGTTDEVTICKEILAKGEMQVSEKERKVELSALFKDVVSVLVEKCVNPATSRPYTMGLIERALKDIHFAVDPKRSAKQQALEALPLLKAKFPIERAMMRVEIQAPLAMLEEIMQLLRSGNARVEQQELLADVFTATCLIQPGTFRTVHNFVLQSTGGSGRIQVVEVAVQDTAGADIEQEVSARSAAAQLDVGISPAHADDPVAARPASLTSPASLYPSMGYAGSAMAVQPVTRARADPSGEVVYAKGSIRGIPDKWENRRDMFLELDRLQSGWLVELRARGDGDTVDATFFDPAGVRVGPYAAARRQALQAAKTAAAS